MPTSIGRRIPSCLRTKTATLPAERASLTRLAVEREPTTMPGSSGTRRAHRRASSGKRFDSEHITSGRRVKSASALFFGRSNGRCRSGLCSCVKHTAGAESRVPGRFGQVDGSTFLCSPRNLTSSLGLRPGVGVKSGQRTIGVVRDPRAEPGANSCAAIMPLLFRKLSLLASWPRSLT